MKKILFLFMGLLLSSLGAFAQSTTIEATPIDNLSTYTGTEPYVFDMTARKYYAYNNLNQYEEMGLYPEVSTLKVAGGGATQIDYIATEEVNGTEKVPYINTNYIPKANTKIVLDVDIANSTSKGWMAVFGARQGGWYSHAFVLFARAWDAQTGCFNRTNDEHAADSDIPREQRMTIEAVGKTCTFTLAGQSTPTLTITTNDGSTVEDCTNSLYLFDTNTAGAGGNQRDNSYVFMKLYGCQIYEGETLVKNFVPIVNAEGIGGLKETLSGQEFLSASSNNFALSPDGQAIADDAGISVYPGKLVINTSDEHEYKWDGTQWVDLGSVYQPIADTNYQNMNNWTCRFGYDSTYDNIENTNGNDNFFNPYKGEGGWEPYQVSIDGLTKGETYRFSFKFTSEGWTSWDNDRWAALPVFVTNNWDFPQNDFYPTSVGGQVLGFTTLPKAAVTNQPYSFNFVADDNNVLAVNFGVVDDNPNYLFHFDDLLIELADYPEKYDLTWVDPNKYTPLEYIESTSAIRENAYTTPYIAKASTEVDIKFQLYSNNNWAAIFSGRNGQASGNGISLYKNGGADQFGYFVGGYIQDNHAPFPGFNQDITVAATLGNLNVNGTDYSTGQTTFNASTRGISMFANPEWDNPIRGRIYYMTIKEGTETIYDFQPVMRHDGVFGYYDAATATFVIPAQGHLTGYGYKKFTDRAYMTYDPDTRIVIAGNSAKYLPDVQNLDGATYTWSSADPNIATVAADGTVTGVNAGSVMITVTTDADDGWTASYELTVSEPNYVRHDVNNVGYAVVTGGNGWGDSPVENILDNNASTKFGCSDTGDAWAIIIAENPVAVSQYSFVTGADTYNYPDRNPRSWKLEGSNDNENWTTIDVHDDFDAYMIHSVNREEFVFPVNGTDTYKFFKISSTAGGFQLGEFWINEQAHTWGEPTETAATCTAEGKKTWECSDCNALKTEVLPIIAHNYVNGSCTVCQANINEVVLLRDGQTDPYAIKFRHMAGSDNNIDIEAGWNTADFDDSAWDELMMPIGSNGYDDGARNGAKYNTIWFNEYNTYWFRRTFEVEDPSQIAVAVLKILHDDNMWAYVNGTMVRECPGGNDWTNGTGWQEIVINPSLLVSGKNVISICIEQNFGGAYCDFSLIGSLQLALDETKSDNVTKISAFEGATMPVVLARPLVSGTYNTIILPFDMTADEIATAFGAGTSIATLASYDAEKNNYSFQSATEIEAGVAYLIKPTADAPEVYNFTNKTISATIDDASLFVGSFDPQNVAVGDKIVAAGNTVKAVTTAGQIKGFRAFFPASTGSGAKDATFTIDGESTGIIGIDGEIIETTGNIYDLQGRKVNKPQHGVYIVNGKKIVIK